MTSPHLPVPGAGSQPPHSEPGAPQEQPEGARPHGESPHVPDTAVPTSDNSTLLRPAAPELPGYRHVYSGKVRDLYAPLLGSGAVDPGRLLVVATDRISAYDHVLPTVIPDKGRVLTQLSLWWFDQLADLVPNHVLSTDVPADVEGRAVLVQRLDMFPVECVARGYLAGSGLAEYRESGAVCGVPLRPGLTDGSRLDAPIFTPATKAELGEHDENVTFEQVAATVGADVAEELRRITLAVYSRGEQLARDRGILLADTKIELGRHPDGRLVLGDEVLTPDSSRFWPAVGWAPGGPQPSFDKQYVRDWLTSPASGWDRAGDEPPPALPDDVVERTRAKYVEAYEALTGQRFG
jgi:phosphoribosylaminoimidazole-succinocarboxamide synthase